MVIYRKSCQRFLCLIGLLLASFYALSAQDSPKLKVVVTNYLELPPYSWEDRCQNRPTGAIIHILNKLSKDLDRGIEVYHSNDYKAYPYNQLKEAFYSGQYDLMFGSSGFEAGPGVEKVEHPIIVFYGNIAARKEGGGDADDEDKSDEKLIGIIGQNTYRSVYQYLKNNGYAQVKYPSIEAAYKGLSDGQVNALLIDYYMSKIFLIGNPSYKNFSNTRVEEMDRRGYLYFLAESPAKVQAEKINNFLESYHRTGLVKEINNLYLNIWVNDSGCVGNFSDSYPGLSFERIK